MIDDWYLSTGPLATYSSSNQFSTISTRSLIELSTPFHQRSSHHHLHHRCRTILSKNTCSPSTLVTPFLRFFFFAKLHVPNRGAFARSFLEVTGLGTRGMRVLCLMNGSLWCVFALSSEA